jgi:hypothetical protein
MNFFALIAAGWPHSHLHSSAHFSLAMARDDWNVRGLVDEHTYA